MCCNLLFETLEHRCVLHNVTEMRNSGRVGVLVFVTFVLKLARMEVHELLRSTIVYVTKMNLKELLSDRPELKVRSSVRVW